MEGYDGRGVGMNKRIKKKVNKKRYEERMYKLSKMKNPNIGDILKAVYGNPIPFGYNPSPKMLHNYYKLSTGDAFAESVSISYSGVLE